MELPLHLACSSVYDADKFVDLLLPLSGRDSRLSEDSVSSQSTMARHRTETGNVVRMVFTSTGWHDSFVESSGGEKLKRDAEFDERPAGRADRLPKSGLIVCQVVDLFAAKYPTECSTQKSHGDTVTHFVTRLGKVAVLKALLQSGADANEKNVGIRNKTLCIY